MNYSASDVGGGIYRQRLLADGVEVASGTVDDNGGRCVRYPVGNGFSSPVPCRLNASGSLTYDTAGLTDGPHELELQVFDATNENKVVSSWPVQVDNTPPSVGDVDVTGTAHQGETLHCGASVGGQSVKLAYQWLRANPDGSDVREIPGATGEAYVVAAADVGKKLMCRLTATDAGGSTTHTSGLTTGPFANGGVVREGVSPSAGGGSASDPTAVAKNLTPIAACTRSTVEMFGTVRRLTRSYNHSGFTLSGRLTARSGGAATAGATLEVVQTVTRAGIGQRKRVSSATTGADGSFRAKVPPGPTRAVQLVEAGCGAVGPVVGERVRGALQAKTTTRRVRNRHTARFRGRILGGYLGRGLPLELQVRVGASWKDVKAVTSNARGEYKVGYRFMRTYVRYTYRFRVVTRAGGAWPYMAAHSRQVKVRVN